MIALDCIAAVCSALYCSVEQSFVLQCRTVLGIAEQECFALQCSVVVSYVSTISGEAVIRGLSDEFVNVITQTIPCNYSR